MPSVTLKAKQAKAVPHLEGPIRPIGEQVSEILNPSVQVSSRIKSAQKAAAFHAGNMDDALTRLTSGAGRFRSGVDVVASTTHFSGAVAHGVTDPAQDLSKAGGPLQLVEQVLQQMSELGSRAVAPQAGQLPGM